LQNLDLLFLSYDVNERDTLFLSEPINHSAKLRGSSGLDNGMSLVLFCTVNEANRSKGINTVHGTLLKGNFIRERYALQGCGDHVLLETSTNCKLLVWLGTL
jgi:hypothetical protein